VTGSKDPGQTALRTQTSSARIPGYAEPARRPYQRADLTRVPP